MNHDEHELSQAAYLLANHIGYQQRLSSPDSDSSSTSSIFSSDGKSSQGSPLSSPIKSERSWNGESSTQVDCKQPYLQVNRRRALEISQLIHEVNTESRPDIPRQNPRRTQSAAQSSVCQTQSLCPPQLTRQCDRTQNFVEQLVDTTTQMIEVIWPLSVTSCDKDYLGGNNLIGLRLFIQEVLKRSKTSFYTLQVALYYLVLIKPCVPTADFSQQQTDFTHAQRAMRCGRRMFLAALILASKYLQDRNYSARAWCKISGLTVAEINSNEMAFLAAVKWKLHIPENQFNRWTNIIYKYSASHSASSPLGARDLGKTTWRRIVPRLTPELDEVDIEKFSMLTLKSLSCNPIPRPFINITREPPTPDGDKTPTPATARLAPVAALPHPSPPYSPRIPALPTPVMTPHMNGFCPAPARAWSCGQAMKESMQQIQQDAFKRYSQDSWPTAVCRPRKPLSRVLSNASMISSPESMISDITQSSCSSRTSRSSSISSTVSAGARHGCFGNRFANHRAALARLNGTGFGAPCVMQSKLEAQVAASDCDPVDNAEMDATLALINLSRPENYMTSKRPPKPEHGQKRARPLSVADNNISSEVRSLLSQEYDANEQAVVPDSFEAETFVLSKSHLINYRVFPSVGSQIGARKKQRSYDPESSYITTSC